MVTSTIISPAVVAQHIAGFTVERYAPDRKAEWNAFVQSAKNATFLFDRDYMEYHSHRFVDYSLMVFHGKKLMGLLPGNLNADGDVISHGGLTYGGLILPGSVSLLKVMACFHASLHYL